MPKEKRSVVRDRVVHCPEKVDPADLRKLNEVLAAAQERYDAVRAQNELDEYLAMLDVPDLVRAWVRREKMVPLE